jgi:hypothetical protein
MRQLRDAMCKYHELSVRSGEFQTINHCKSRETQIARQGQNLSMDAQCVLLTCDMFLKFAEHGQTQSGRPNLSALIAQCFESRSECERANSEPYFARGSEDTNVQAALAIEETLQMRSGLFGFNRFQLLRLSLLFWIMS